MPFHTAFRFSSVVLAATAFVSLALAADLALWLQALGSASLILSLLRTLGHSWITKTADRLTLSPSTWNTLLVIAFVGFWLDFLVISQELLPAGIDFLVALLVNKLFNLEQRRDFLHLYAISLMSILASAALTTEVWYAPVFLAYMVAGVWTLLLYHLTQEPERASATKFVHSLDGPSARYTGRITGRFFWATNGMAVGAFCLTIAIFFAIPRVGVGFFQKGRGETLRTSGFSERVDLGVIGPVKEDPSIVMRVELPNEPPPANGSLYLRGMTYDQYDGRTWRTTLSHRYVLAEAPRGTFRIPQRPKGAASHRSASIRQDILLEALDSTILFGAPFAEVITGDMLALQSDSAGVLHLPFSTTTRLRYTVVSRSHELSPEERTQNLFRYQDDIRRQYAQAPTMSPEVIRLAQTVVQNAQTPYEVVTTIKQHLLTNYRYSLNVGSTTSLHPLEDFLFSRKTGYCEHYATAMVMMLRAAGLPARLVTGFLATEWNQFGQYYTVRQRDAHAWVEVYFPQSGWITVDPTPPVASASAGAWWSSMTSVVDSIRLQWDRFFVRYGATDQIAVVHGIREGGDAIRTRFTRSIAFWLSEPLQAARALVTRLGQADGHQLLTMVGLFLLGVAALSWMAIRKPWTLLKPRPESRAQHLVINPLYDQMIRLLAASGLRKSPNSTPREFAVRVRHEWAEASQPVDALTHLYYRVRFGQVPITSKDLTLANQWLQRLRLLRRPRVG